MRKMEPRTHKIVLLAAILMVCGVASEAAAGGFAAARFGGEHGNPTESNPESLYYNPAGFGLSKGTQLTLDSSFVFRNSTYERPSGEGVDPANAGKGTVNNFLISPMFGVTSDFGLDIPLVFSLGFYAPFGGQAVWDKVDEDPDHPGAVDGPQRWYSIDGTIRTLAYSAGVAYRLDGPRLAIGLSGNVLQSTVDTIRARNGDGSDDLVDEAGNIKEGRSYLDATSIDYSIGVGVLWEAMPDKLWIGASYQSRPLGGTMELEGTLQSVIGTAEPSESDITITQNLPDIIRLGGRFRPMENLELRLFADYTLWSAFDQQCITNDAASNIEESCKTASDGANQNPGVVQVLGRHWEDTFGIRAGGSYWINDLELIAGGGFDSNAIPDERLEPALIDMNKFTASLGAAYQISKNINLGLTATNVFYAERDTSGTTTAEGLQTSSTQPSSAGIYNQNVFLINTNLALKF